MVIRYKNLRDGTGREEGSGWGTRVYLWQIHVDIWQNQYNIVKLKNKIKKKDICTLMFIVALFNIAKIWKQSKCPSI